MKKFLGIFLASLLVTGAALAANTTSDREDGTYNVTTIRLNAEPVNITAGGGAGTNWYGGVKIYDFKEGAIVIHGALSDVALTVPATGANAVSNSASAVHAAIGTATAIQTTGTTWHTSTRADIIADFNIVSFHASTNDLQSQDIPASEFDGTTTAADAYYNLLIDDGGAVGNPTGTLSGIIRILWSNVGDY